MRPTWTLSCSRAGRSTAASRSSPTGPPCTAESPPTDGIVTATTWVECNVGGGRMGMLSALERGRQAHRAQVWAEAFDLLSEADGRSPLSGEDLELLAEAASMLGRGDDDVRLLRRAF